MNKIEDKDIPERLARAILAALNIHPKSVWLCASRADAERYRNIVTLWLAKNDLMGHPTWMLSSLGDEIDHFKRARRGHLFVAGRFDGMDFKADECRLVVLATLPKAINTQEEFFTAYLRDAGFMLRRLNQRIVQALGRCNRSPDDFGVYILADRRFATHFGKESNRLGVPRNIVAEIDLAEDASELDSKILAKKVESFLRKDFDDFDKELEQHLKNVPASSSLTLDSSDTSANEVNGWAEMFDSQNYEQAQINFEKCWKRSASVNLRELTGFFKWCEAKAYFLKANQGDTSAQKKSLAILESAIESGGLSSWFNRLRSSLNRYRSAQVVSPRFVAETKEYPQFLIKVFDDYLERLGPSGTRFDRWANRVGSMLESTKHGEYQEGLEELGKILGYSAFRPRYNTATDCRWRGVFSSIREVVTFEAKIENVEAGKIIPSHIGQAHTQLERARKEYGHLGYAVCGTIVTHLADLDPAAKSSLGQLRIIEKSIILKLWKRVLHVLSQYRNGWSLEDIRARFTAAEVVISKIPPAGWLTRALAKDGPFISEKEFFAEWPK
jgi:hypothetical protein